MKLRLCSLLAAALLPAQINSVLTVVSPEKIDVKRGKSAVGDFAVQLRQGYHVNSQTPSDEYLIPLRLTWTSTPTVQAGEVSYPQPHFEKYPFAEKPLSVFTGDFKIRASFTVAAGAPIGRQIVAGKLRYQACNDRMCLPPRSADVKAAVVVYP